MARDPIQHEPELLLAGLRSIDAGDRLDDAATVQEELIHLGLIVVAHDGRLLLTREGREFLSVEG